MYLSRLGNAHVHLHVDALALHLDRLRSNSVTEIRKGDDVCKLVVIGKRRVGQHHTDIGTAQHIELSTYTEVVERAPETAAHVNEDLAISQRTLPLRRIDELIVVGSDIHVELYLTEVTEIDIAVEHKRCLARCVCLDAVKVEAAVVDRNRMVGYL